MFDTSAGGRAYPAIFAPDPRVPDDVSPLAVITAEGYVGSVWEAATGFVSQVLGTFRADTNGGRDLFATVVQISTDAIPCASDYFAVQAWVPRREDLPAR
jgi:hypothetical protein